MDILGFLPTKCRVRFIPSFSAYSLIVIFFFLNGGFVNFIMGLAVEFFIDVLADFFTDFFATFRTAFLTDFVFFFI